jgi:hypothetical protein
MEKNRIQIEGVWYVREDQIEKNPIKLDPVKFEGIIFENESFCFEVTRIHKDNGDYYKDVDIKFTDKRIKPWKEDHWDNNTWMRGVLNNDPDSLEALPDNIGSKGIRFFQTILKYLKDNNWL